jgi:hypothetical protein
MIRTRHYASTERCDIELEKGSEFISFARCEDTRFEGTEIVLSFQQFMQVFKDKVETVVSFLNEYVLTEGIKIDVIDRGNQTTYPVSQGLRIDEAPTKGETELDIEPYLIRTHGFVRVRRSGTCFRTIKQVALDDELMMVWDGDNLTQVSDYPLTELLSEEKLQFLTLDVFSDSDKNDFETFLKRFDDLDVIIDKFKRECQITVFLPRDFEEQTDTDTDLDDYATVIDSVTVRDVLDAFSIAGFVPRITAERRSFLRHSKREVYLPYGQIRGNMSSNRWYGALATVFVRGIRISNATLPNLILPSTINIKNVIMNVTHPLIVPDISRNSFDEATQKRLSYAIHKTVVTSVREHMADSQEERELLGDFLERFYCQENPLIRGSAE